MAKRESRNLNIISDLLFFFFFFQLCLIECKEVQESGICISFSACLYPLCKKAPKDRFSYLLSLTGHLASWRE